MKTIVTLALACFLNLAVAGGLELQSEYSIPDAALRKVAQSKPDDSGYIDTWRGHLRVTGNLAIEFDRLPNSGPERDTKGWSFFEPDEISRNKLPQATGKWYPLPAKIVWLAQSPKELLLPLIGKKRTRAVLQGFAPRFEFPVALTLRSFSSGIDCDHRQYTLAIESIVLLKPDVLALNNVKNIGC